MARIDSAYDLAGRYGNLVVYWVGDQLYGRTKSCLDRKRFRKAPAFKKSREKAKAFGVASQLAKQVYKSLPEAVKVHGLFGQLTGFIHQGLQGGKSKEMIVEAIQVYFGSLPPVEAPKAAKPTRRSNKGKVTPPPLSKWRVTKEGQLQPFIPSSPLRIGLRRRPPWIASRVSPTEGAAKTPLRTSNDETSLVLGINMSVVSDNSRPALHNALNDSLNGLSIGIPIDIMILEDESWLNTVRNIQNSLFYKR